MNENCRGRVAELVKPRHSEIPVVRRRECSGRIIPDTEFDPRRKQAALARALDGCLDEHYRYLARLQLRRIDTCEAGLAAG
jgi:hypothetical protein